MANPTPKTIPSRKATAGIAFAFTAATGTEQSIAWMPGGILLVLNDHATDAKTYSATSNPKNSRDSDSIVAESLAAGVYHVSKRFPAQDNDVLLVTGESSDIKFAVLDTRAQPS